jgi:lipopolysaccharide export system protein LptC
MMQRLGAWFPVVLLALMAALTIWLDRQVQPPEGTADGKTRHDPDYIVDNLSATRVGPDGTPRYTLSTRHMMHFPDDDTTHLETPRLVSYRGSAAAVTMSSKTALLSSNGENAYLIDDVRLVRTAVEGKSELVMRTSWLQVIPDDDIAKTDRPVEISDANTLITSVGLEFNNSTRILKLLSNVRGTYAKTPPAR